MKTLQIQQNTKKKRKLNALRRKFNKMVYFLNFVKKALSIDPPE